MNYEWLFSFVTFAEHMNFTRAAKVLNLSQPALHVQIRKLTEAVGRPLYRKEGRNLHLTVDGERLVAFGRQVREQGDHLLAEIQGGGPTGPLIVASGQGAFLYLLGTPIRRFPKHRWPLRLKTMSGPDALEAVQNAQAHLAVVATPNPPSDLSAHALREVGQSVILPTAHRLARRKTLRPKDLTNKPLIVAPEGSPHRTMLAQLFLTAGVNLNVAVEAQGWELMIAFVRYGIGVAIVNDFCSAPRGTKAITLVGAPPISYYALHRPGVRLEALRVMMALIQKNVGPKESAGCRE